MAAVAPARTRAAAAPVRRPRPEAQPRPAAKPRLRIVDDARIKAAHRRRRARLVVVLAAIVATGCLFALAAFNAVLVSGQGHLDGLEQRVAEAQSQYSTNRLEVAKLESPDRIVQAAQTRLGMVPPPNVRYLTPSEAMAAEAGTTANTTRTTTDGGGAGTSSWAAAKPYLDGRP